MQLHYVIRKQVSRVDLQKDGTTSIGIVLKDGVKTGSRPVIKAIKKGSIAYRSHCVSVSDAIVSVCGQDARGMSRKDFKHLLREADDQVEIELEYQIREACLNRCGVYCMERIIMKLKKESESFGFVLRKYGIAHSVSPGYPIISDIREGGPADRDGRMKAGDRMVQIDDQNLEMLSLLQVANILQAKDEATFTIEYKIALIENFQIKLGERTNLEIDCPDADLGLVLGCSGTRMIIEEIHKGSLADRCGAFRVDDDIVAINDIDVAFLSASKANNLLRTFRREPGKLVLVANTERLSRQDSNLPRENIKPLLNELSAHSSTERDQQVPSNNHLLVPCNSPQSLFAENFEDNHREAIESGYYIFRMKTFLMFREVMQSIANLEKFLSSLTGNKRISSVNNLTEIQINSNLDQTIPHGKLSHLKVLSTLIKNSVHSMAMHLVENGGIGSNRCSKKDAPPSDSSKDNSQHLNQDDVIEELMKNLVEIYTKKLMSKHNLEKLKLKINQINSNCRKCKESCMLAALTTQKMFILVALNSKTRDICLLIKRFIEDILRILPCEDCRVSSRYQTGSGITRTTRPSTSWSHLISKPSSSGHVLNEKTSCSLPPIISDVPRSTGVKSSDHLRARPSSLAPFLFSSQNKIEYPSPADGFSANVTIYKPSNCEDISDLNCKTKTSHATKSSSYEERHQREQKADDSGSSCFVTPPQQLQNEAQFLSPRFQSTAEVHNCVKKDVLLNQNVHKADDSGSLCFATPTHQLQNEPQFLSSARQLTTDGVQNCLKRDEHLNTNVQKANDSGSLCFTTPTYQVQNESQITPIHNNSLGFATPNRFSTHHDRASICRNSSQQFSIETSSNTQNKSLSHQAGLIPSNDNAHYERRDNGKNYTSNIHKKIFREKGLLKGQGKSCKSAEVIADSEESESLQLSKPKIQKHSSEPQFLSPGYQSTSDGVPNCIETDEHLIENVEMLDNKSEMEGATAGLSRHWSPFHMSDYNDRPNILDIPNWSAKSSHSMKQTGQVSNERTMQDRVDVTLKNEGKGFGLRIEFLGSPSEDSTRVPRITAVSSQGAAHKAGILLKGDRVLSINGQNTTGMTETEFGLLKEEAFSADEVLLTVEFDIVLRELQFGTFDVCVTKISKTGLIYNDFKKGSPLVVKGIAKGSPAHRCGSLFPGDEVLYAENIRQEFYDVSENTYERSEYVIIRVRRQTFQEKYGGEMDLDEAGHSPLKTYDLNRTSIHSNHDSNKIFLEQEFTLYRDPVAKDFGFLIGQDQLTKTIYITGIRPDGPADCSKVIRLNDMILQVNGVDLEEHRDGPVVSFFQTAGDRLVLKTCRMLKYE